MVIRRVASRDRKDTITGYHLGDACQRLSPSTNSGDEFAILQLDAIHRYIDAGQIDGFIGSGRKLIVARKPRPPVANVAEVASERPSLLKLSASVQIAPLFALSWIDMSIAIPRSG
jgi:hypothetical protein